MKKLILVMLQIVIVTVLACTACTQPEDAIQQDNDVFQISTPFNEADLQYAFPLTNTHTNSPEITQYLDNNFQVNSVSKQYSIFNIFSSEESFETEDPYYTAQLETASIEVQDIIQPKAINAQLFESSTSNDVKEEVREAVKLRHTPEATKTPSKQSSQIIPTELVETIDMSLYSPMLIADIQSSGWTGEPLTKSRGAIIGPSGKETYYNLPMEGVVRRMYQMGFEGEYWVRADGAKMLGPYIMVAANLQIRPKGTLVETSLGLGIVADTGTFALYNPTQLDIAVAW